jgi:poly(A) polymerase
MTPEQATLRFLSQLIQNGPFHGQVYVAGGFVRDLVLNRPCKDIDLVIPQANGGVRFAEWVCKELGIHTPANPVIFPRFGTAKFNLRGQTFEGIDLSEIDIECVMTRTETYTDGSRKPDVEFGTLKEDAERRDFTINSLFYDLTTDRIIDLTGMGLHDIKNGLIRSAIDPNIIFAEDPLRMLRAIRFAGKFNWELDDVLKMAMVDNSQKIHTISAERIQEELCKMLLTDTPSNAIYRMLAFGLLDEILPEISALFGLRQNKYHMDAVFGHTMMVLDLTPPDLTTRLAALFHDVGKKATWSEDETGVHFYRHEEVGESLTQLILTRLKFSNEMITNVCVLVRHHMRLKGAGEDGGAISDKALRKLQAELGGLTNALLNLIHADNLSHAKAYQMPQQIPGIWGRLNTLGEVARKITLPINGNDVMDILGIRPGPAVKQALEAVREAWFENPALTKDEAIEIVKTAGLLQ